MGQVKCLSGKCTKVPSASHCKRQAVLGALKGSDERGKCQGVYFAARGAGAAG